jgi:hypothetical protein
MLPVVADGSVVGVITMGSIEQLVSVLAAVSREQAA